MLFIDVNYVNQLSSRVRNFKQKNDYNWNFSCPFCGDSKTNALKARGYVYRTKSDLFYKCHNCGKGTNLGNLIKHLDEQLYKEYCLERYREGATKYNDHNKPIISDTKPEIIEVKDDVLSGLRRIDTLPIDHPAYAYVKNRKIPKDKLELLYYAPKWKKYVNKVKFTFTSEENDHPRLVIPFFNEHGRVYAFQGRAFGDEQPRYMTIKIDEDMDRIFGLERIDFSKTIYATEGPIDSLFLPNAIAVAGASFDSAYIQGLKSKLVIIFDREPRNKELVKQIDKCIELEYTVCLLPDTVEQKDINEMVLAGVSSDKILDLINTNTYSGIEAKLKFADWRKC